MPEIGGFVVKIVAFVCLFRYNRTVVPRRGYSGTNRAGRLSKLTSPNSPITEKTPVRMH